MVSRIILITLLVLTSGCSTEVKIIKNNQVLNKNNGIFLTKLQTNYPFQMTLRNSKNELIHLKNKTSSLLAMSLPAGKYSIHEISWKEDAVKFNNQDSYNFLIKNGKVNYICDFGAYFRTKKKTSENTQVNLDFVLPFYSKRSTYKEFKNGYPKLAKSHSLISSPVSKCVRGKSSEAQNLMKLLTQI